LINELNFCYYRFSLIGIITFQNILQLRDLQNGQLLKTYALEMGTVREFSGKNTSSEFFFQFGSFLTPGVIYRCDIGESVEAEPTVFRQIELNGFDPSLFETQQVFYPSKDGSRIPMFIVKKKVIDFWFCFVSLSRIN
jgi:prolyl oligopeptidase